MTTAPLTQAENKAGAMPPWLNRTMIWLLRSPFHRMVSGSVMLITFTGRKSGKRYTIPVSYTQQGEAIIAFTHGAWSKNLRNGAPVTLRLQGRDVQGVAHAITNDLATILPYLRIHLRQLTRDLRFYHVRLDANGQPDEADLAKAAETSVLIRITPEMTTKETPYAVA